jgi:hypothetical protein
VTTEVSLVTGTSLLELYAHPGALTVPGRHAGQRADLPAGIDRLARSVPDLVLQVPPIVDNARRSESEPVRAATVMPMRRARRGQ